MHQTNQEMERHGLSPWSFVLGLAAGAALGVVTTVIIATFAEEKFVRVTRRTRQFGDGVQDLAEGTRDAVVNSVHDVAAAAKKQADQFNHLAHQQAEKATGKLVHLAEGLHESVTE